MTVWDKKETTQKRPRNPRGRPAGVKVLPYVEFTPPASLQPGEDGKPSPFDVWLEKLRTNYGSTLKPLKHLFPENKRIERVTVAHHAGGIPAHMEVRLSVEKKHPSDSGKTYRNVFRAETKNNPNPKDDHLSQLVAGFEHAKYGLHVPTNAPALIAAQKLAEKEERRVCCVWCEGEPTREAVAKLIEHPTLVDHFDESGFSAVTSAWLGGMTGAKLTNFELKPPPNVDPEYTMPGVNDQRLKLSEHRHLIVVDNDDAGRSEAREIARRLQKDYEVPSDEIFFVDPPKGAPVRWDDADKLPIDVTIEDRIKHYLEPRQQIDWVYRPVRGGIPEIDPFCVSNRKKALQLAGLVSSYTDTATETDHHVGPFKFKSNTPNEAETFELARRALKIMGHNDLLPYLNHWDEVLSNMAWDDANLRDLIHEETMDMIARGKLIMSDDNKPENLLIRMFDLEPTDYNKHAGWHFIRDALAMRLRPAFRGKPPLPQLFYVLLGTEGSGKSTCARVLVGERPDAEPDSVNSRWTGDVKLSDVAGNDTHGNLGLIQKVQGKLIVEFADVAMGDAVGKTRANMLKNLVNQGTLAGRGINAKKREPYRCRHQYLFTLNDADILNDDMGSRRWVIIDTTKTKTPTVEQVRERIGSREPTDYERMILEGKNPNLDWVADNLPAMFAHMYDDPAWRGSLNAKPEFLAFMPNVQTDYQQTSAWQDTFREDMAKLARFQNIHITAGNISLYAGQRFPTEKITSREYGAFLKKIGWKVTGQIHGGERYWAPANQPLLRRDRRYVCWETHGNRQGKWNIPEVVSEADAERLADLQAPF